MAPFQYEQYRNPFVGSIGELMMQPARAQAQAELQKGAVWSNAADRIAQFAGSIPGQMAQQREQQQRDELIGGQLADARARRAGNTAVDTLMQGDQLPANDAGPRQENYTDANGLFDVPKLNQALAHMGLGHMAPELLKGAESINESITNHQALEQKTAQAKTLIFGDMADGALKLAKLGMPVSDAMDFVVQPGIATGRIAPQEYAQLRQQIARLPPEQQAAALTTFMDSAAKLGGGETLGKDAQRLDRYGRTIATNTVEEPNKGDYTGPDGIRYHANGKPVTGDVMKPQTAPKSYQKSSVMLDGKPAEILTDPTPGGKVYDLNGTVIDNAAQRIKPIPPASTLVTPQAVSDVKEAVSGMKDGTLPPVMPGRATKEYLATMAEAHRQGYDLQGAVSDWNATQKHIATLNNAQQTRLRQSINALPELLDSVDALASKWKGGRFPLLNSANLKLAKNGAYGEGVATIARQLDSQIADVTADLGSVYMGGNSPTDHALGLAAKSLSGDWSEKVLHDMVTLARGNVTIRNNSIKNTGVAGASDTNPYGAKNGGGGNVQPTGRFNPATGKIEPVN